MLELTANSCHNGVNDLLEQRVILRLEGLEGLLVTDTTHSTSTDSGSPRP